jgi:hypothetical protein
MSTKISPNQVFRLVGLLPRRLQKEFQQEAYQDVVVDTEEFIPDAERKYEHSLGLSWLTKHKIPNTVEELEAQRQYVFNTMISGADRYNVGQFIVLLPSVVHHSREIENNLLVVEVMDELDFPAIDLKTPYTEAMRQTHDHRTESLIALRAALQVYAADGKIRVHEAGHRVYSGSDEYQFQERFHEEIAEENAGRVSTRRR